MSLDETEKGTWGGAWWGLGWGGVGWGEERVPKAREGRGVRQGLRAPCLGAVPEWRWCSGKVGGAARGQIMDVSRFPSVLRGSGKRLAVYVTRSLLSGSRRRRSKGGNCRCRMGRYVCDVTQQSHNTSALDTVHPPPPPHTHQLSRSLPWTHFQFPDRNQHVKARTLLILAYHCLVKFSTAY